MTGYTGYSDSPELQEGNFLVLHFSAPGSDSILVELVGGHSGPKELDPDGLAVARIESNEQYIRAYADYGARGMLIREISIDNLTLNPS